MLLLHLSSLDSALVSGPQVVPTVPFGMESQGLLAYGWVECVLEEQQGRPYCFMPTAAFLQFCGHYLGELQGFLD